MNKYSGWADEQINKETAVRKGLKLCDGQHYEPKASYWDNGLCTMFDACNNWADAGPLMVEIRSKGLDICMDTYGASACNEDFNFLSDNKNNMCRAISECYLLMTDEINN